MTETYIRRRLDNGLEVILAPVPFLRTALVSLFVKVGPRYETDDERGLSNFVAQCIYEGSEAHPSQRELNRAVQQVAGELDQAVYQDHAIFWLRVHADFLNEGVRLLAETVQRPRFDPEGMERVRQILMHDLEQYTLDNLHSLTLELMSPELPRRMIVPGELECVEAFDAAAVRDHFAQVYVPGNMALVIAGRFDAARAFDAAAAYFDGPPRPAPPPTPLPPVELAPGPKWVLRSTGRSQAVFLLRHQGMRYEDEGAAALTLVNALFESGWRGEGAHLFRVDSELNFTHDFSLFDIYARATDDNLTRALGAIIAWIDLCTGRGVEETDLQRVRSLTRCRLEFTLDNLSALSGWLGARALLHPDDAERTIADEIARVNAVTAAEVQAVMRAVFAPERRYLAVLSPQMRYVRRGRIERLLHHGARESAAIAREAADADDFAGALEAYEEAVAVEPDNAEIYYDLARASLKAGEMARAVSALQAISRLEGATAWLKRAAVEPDFAPIRDLPAVRELFNTHDDEAY